MEGTDAGFAVDTGTDETFVVGKIVICDVGENPLPKYVGTCVRLYVLWFDGVAETGLDVGLYEGDNVIDEDSNSLMKIPFKILFCVSFLLLTLISIDPSVVITIGSVTLPGFSLPPAARNRSKSSIISKSSTVTSARRFLGSFQKISMKYKVML
jgi:hypothetical protein